jgi:hypothetical protein
VHMCTYCRVHPGNCRIAWRNIKYRLCYQCVFYALDGEYENPSGSFTVCPWMNRQRRQLLIND